MNRPRSGFTLVELLVVISIIGVLMGLLLPAVGAVREASRRNQCSTQIKNLSMAAITYENSKGEMPGYVQSFGRYVGGTGAIDPSDPGNGGVGSHMKIGTWAVALLPSLDAQPAYEHWTEDRYPIIHGGGGTTSGATSGESGASFHQLAAPNLAVMQCASNPVSLGEFGKNSYIANTGMSISGTLPSGFTRPSVSFVGSQSRGNGVFNNKYNVNSSLVHVSEGPKFRIDDIKDGAGNTMLFSESVQALPWHRAGFVAATDFTLATATDKDVVFDATASGAGGVLAARFVHGMVWHYADDATGMSGHWNTNGASEDTPCPVQSFWKINGGGTTVSDDIFTLAMNVTNSPNLARPSSAHTDGVNAAMADGGTRFIADSIDYRVYQALLTPRGKSSNVPWPEFVITDDAF
ncbi:prepilin-type N-terminal cleavage/methylation domain-containing protein [Neorhodopirellula lusitana]|uniref:Prepilin-type N-terminal cleavage/methylation domain-containing protein n=1 Tax=Neorhodopirellula lusitana TaxID=445327 RepID=A0ABY1PP21_9BACT|nr:DUF1559 domain-containing protein [Neorhodopirellula lusitana]SMP40558.1 prepilin-type N-terminal cleavage/methylation domain-containing protein [Neorhodopirellula lusitana]